MMPGIFAAVTLFTPRQFRAFLEPGFGRFLLLLWQSRAFSRSRWRDRGAAAGGGPSTACYFDRLQRSTDGSLMLPTMTMARFLLSLCLGSMLAHSSGAAGIRFHSRRALQAPDSALLAPYQDIDPRSWAPFLPPPVAPSPSEDPRSFQSPVSYSPPSPAFPVATSPLQKPAAVVLPAWLATAAPSPHSPGPFLAKHELDEDQGLPKLTKGMLLTVVLVPTLLGGSILFSTFVAWMCHRPPSLRHSPAGSQRSDGYSSGGSGRGPFAPWLWGRSFNAPRKELAHSFEFPLLQAATSNFGTANLLGEGGSGRVYKARLDDDCFAAVKLLFSEGKQAEQAFQAEVELLSGIRHPNLVSLLGFSSHGDQRLLVYEYMQNGSLQDQLHGPLKGSILSWHLRMKIALDSARGLEHLHEHCNPLVIHRDFKSSNILLDASFNAKVADFGLALSAPTGIRQDEIVQGTLGYVAPEYILNGSLTEKSDVYAFGVVLLELITGRKPIDPSMPTGSESLVTWVLPLLGDRASLPTVIDPVLQGTVDTKHLHQVAAVAMLCVQAEPSYRPLIADVVNSLIPLVPIELGGTLRVAETVLENKSFAALQWNVSSNDSIVYGEDAY
ncbi:probable receptor-like protein kinase At1g80640 isoform X2 [Selaginella moellendorffii]|uniref:probable receptor-like protein kinase At1g80640 isoform X2 n=1 Tax=Selaginella moellendorffii TaxID=88036 RepID=UPI000D1C3F97|nr:probable receptor-like protein kinase At1g80640 isoform X2 [Selaginella moellendorffii]|eukprot:XP_024525645.1 probable receptor-like protein kinase At1g80640 isoform X2 [Selaginella moellendorffii]